ncbi:hypothetical protein N7486_004732 [Penicillium sp. IBT 16267x]|nr:hypothetical protein N7486_004732 [Penicillium sp. IBT 16267x]
MVYTSSNLNARRHRGVKATPREDYGCYPHNNARNPWLSGTEGTAFQLNGPHEPSAAQFALLSVCPIISVQEGDFLGVFAAVIRYSNDFSATYGVPGPKEKIWLDYSKV